MATVSVALEVPSHREDCIQWLNSQTPDRRADLLESLQHASSMGNPIDIVNAHTRHISYIQTAHTQELHRINTERLWERKMFETHTQELNIKDTETHIENTLLDATIAFLEKQLVVFKKEAQRLRASCVSLENDEYCIAQELTRILTEYHTQRRRFPRQMSEVLRLLPPEQSERLKRDPSLYNSAIQELKREHHRVAGLKRKQPQGEQ